MTDATGATGATEATTSPVSADEVELLLDLIAAEQAHARRAGTTMLGDDPRRGRGRVFSTTSRPSGGRRCG